MLTCKKAPTASLVVLAAVLTAAAASISTPASATTTRQAVGMCNEGCDAKILKSGDVLMCKGGTIDDGCKGGTSILCVKNGNCVVLIKKSGGPAKKGPVAQAPKPAKPMARSR
jgi:hypothetical protein